MLVLRILIAPFLVSIPPLPVTLNQISNQITNDSGVPLDLEHAYTKLSDNALARSGMMPERRPISTFGGGASPRWHWGVIDERRMYEIAEGLG
ncbi:hypothetical protein B9Z19DRAFT_1086337 [Tuber borchii]|uniref:Ubiquitin-like domain-containing protein n=1 Tax=Tuber borchii TaxID=42251 RepID=A0A2T6ZPP8_TUBBO|nr:hypothetical protein B9Z19DRAFT_1086337 [Tuber borchii]